MGTRIEAPCVVADAPTLPVADPLAAPSAVVAPPTTVPPPRWARLARDALRGAIAVLVVHAFVVQVSVVRGHSMEPCLQDGDRLVVDRLSCSLGDVDRFDVVVLGNPRDPSVDYVKRVIGLPGDRVRLVDGSLLVNGEAAFEDFGPVHDRATTRELVVPEGFVWVLGDNRPVSCDSREFGLVAVRLLRGTVRARFWPPSRLAVW